MCSAVSDRFGIFYVANILYVEFMLCELDVDTLSISKFVQVALGSYLILSSCWKTSCSCHVLPHVLRQC